VADILTRYLLAIPAAFNCSSSKATGNPSSVANCATFNFPITIL